MKKTLMVSAICSAIATFSISTAASAATDLKCGCYAPLESSIAEKNPADGYNLNCESADQFTTTGTAVSVQKSDLKVYVDASGAVQGDNDMDITFRSRDKKNFTSAYEANGNLLWAGSKNDNNDQKVGGFSISGGNGSWTAGFKGVTSGTDYVGVVLFADLAQMGINAGKKTMIALCLQDH